MITYDEALNIELEKATTLLQGWRSEQYIRDIAECRAQGRVVAERERLDLEHVRSLTDEALRDELALRAKESGEARARLFRAEEELKAKRALRDASAIEQAQAGMTRIEDEYRRARSLVMMLREQVAFRETLARRKAVTALIADKKTQDAISQNIDALGRVVELYKQWPNANSDDGTGTYLLSLIQGLRKLQRAKNANSN
jgi:hypothetical protein